MINEKKWEELREKLEVDDNYRLFFKELLKIKKRCIAVGDFKKMRKNYGIIRGRNKCFDFSRENSNSEYIIFSIFFEKFSNFLENIVYFF